jgi:hypothetical protein
MVLGLTVGMSPSKDDLDGRVRSRKGNTVDLSEMAVERDTVVYPKDNLRCPLIYSQPLRLLRSFRELARATLRLSKKGWRLARGPRKLSLILPDASLHIPLLVEGPQTHGSESLKARRAGSLTQWYIRLPRHLAHGSSVNTLLVEEAWVPISLSWIGAAGRGLSVVFWK